MKKIKSRFSEALNDLAFYYQGYQKCEKKHSWGPGIRDHYIIHFVLEGKGVFRCNKAEYHLSRGDGFVIIPNRIVSYEADASQPWEYTWFGFHGVSAEALLRKAGLSENTPVFCYEGLCEVAPFIQKPPAAAAAKPSGTLKSLGLFYLLLAELIEKRAADFPGGIARDASMQYAETAIDYMKKNYSLDIKISQVAEYVNISRKYLHRIFKQKFGVSPQNFLIHYRIEMACALMENKSLSIAYIARSVGYHDPLLFSRVFKKTKGLSPKKYMNTML